MPVITCLNPRTEGYDPNTYNSPEVEAAHKASHEITYEGAVLGEYERNMHDDSDFYAIVWDADEKRVSTVQYRTTRGWTYHNNAKVDATESVIAAASAWVVERLIELAVHDWPTPSHGKRVKSLTTRGKYVGVEGVVIGLKKSDYNQYDQVASIKVDGDKFMYPATISIQRLEVISEMDLKEIARAAERRVASQGIVSVVRSWSYI